MRERTAVKVARFVPGRGGMSNPSSLFNGEWKYLYRAVDSNGNTIDFMLSAKRNKKATKRFLKKALGSKHNQIPRAITVDKNPAYPPAINELKNNRILPQNVNLRQIKYLNNIVEQDHRSIKRIVRPMLGFQSFSTATKTVPLQKIWLFYKICENHHNSES